MRKDGRAPDALRAIHIERSYIKNVAGSALIAFGDTKVICTASFDERVPPWLRGRGRGWVTAEYGMLPGASQERVPRDSVQKGRAQEISRLIGRSLRSVTDLAAMGECMVTLDCDVIQADGGTRTAAITGAYVALYEALDRCVRVGNLTEIPLRGHCAAVSVGWVDGEALLDLTYEEDSNAGVDMNIVMDGDSHFIEVQGSAEKQTFDRKQMDRFLALGERGIRVLIAKQKEVLGLD